MNIVDSINVITPQSALEGEDKINVGTVINKSVAGTDLKSRDSNVISDVEYNESDDNDITDEEYEAKKSELLINKVKNDKELTKIEPQDANPFTYQLEDDVATINASYDDLNLEKYHYNYSSAIDNMSIDDIGLVCFPIQKRLQVYKHGANFTIMCVGESGVGKTSFINTLFDSLLIEQKHSYDYQIENFDQSPSKTTKITHHKMEVIEDGFKLKLNVIDTPGFGDFIDNKYCWYPIARYIDEQYRRLVYQENQPDRSNLVHSEVHACLYFIKQSSIGLTPLDIDAMRNLSTRVNLIPIISKADGFTNEEMSIFKQNIRNTLKEENIQICELIDEKSRVKSLIDEMPFSTINSIERYFNVEGNEVRGRQYKWGLSEVENAKHCDFLKLRDFLIESYLGDLISSTENYYENYRKDFMRYRLGKAISLTFDDDDIEKFGIKEYDKEVIVPSSRGSWKSVNKDSSPAHPNLDQLITLKTSIEIIEILNRISLTETEKELVELNPSYLEMEKQVKKKFTVIVQQQNQKFKDWKRTLFEKQDKFNKDIEQVHHRMISLQESIKSLEYLN